MSVGPATPHGLRVALLTPRYWPEVRRGTERVVHDLATELRLRGHRPTVITSHAGPPWRSTEEGVPVMRHWRPPDGRLRRRRYEDNLTHVPFSYLSLSRGIYDVAQALYVTDALAAIRWAARVRRPSIYCHMGIPDHADLTARRGRAARVERVVKGADAVVALSRHAAGAFSRWLGVEARVIYPGVDTRAFTPGERRAELPTVFCAADPAVGRKRIGLLVRAVALVRRERPDLRLVLARPSRPRVAEELERAIPDIEWWDNPDRLAETYRGAWVSVLPSVEEAFGLVLAEALACGTPVVGTRVGGISEILDREEVGRLFDGGERELARALLEVLELAQDPGTRSACRARAQDFSLERSVDAYERLYAELA